jgi:hypothetical protein
MNIGALYGIYLIVVIVFFIIFYITLEAVNALSISISILYASFIGIIVVFLGFIWLSSEQLTTNESMQLSILLIIAFLLPTFLIIYITYMKEQACQRKDCLANSSQGKTCQQKLDDTPTCTGFCQKESYYEHHHSGKLAID